MSDNYSMIFTVVNKGFSSAVMEAGRAAGARGGTVINARGTGSADMEKILGFKIEPEKEIVFIACEDSARKEIMQSIHRACGLASDAHGFSFSIPIDDILGTISLPDKEQDGKDGQEND